MWDSWRKPLGPLSSKPWLLSSSPITLSANRLNQPFFFFWRLEPDWDAPPMNDPLPEKAGVDWAVGPDGMTTD